MQIFSVVITQVDVDVYMNILLTITIYYKNNQKKNNAYMKLNYHLVPIPYYTSYVIFPNSMMQIV